MKYPKGIIKIEFEGHQYLAEYCGRQKGFKCIVCRKGNNAYTFNILHSNDINEYWKGDYETWGFGAEHLDLVKFIEVVLPYGSEQYYGK